jgi:hypothetical protein
MFHLDLLEERGVLLGEPYTRQLSGKLPELRFYCCGERIRISYWIASGRRIIALTPQITPFGRSTDLHFGDRLTLISAVHGWRIGRVWQRRRPGAALVRS